MSAAEGDAAGDDDAPGGEEPGGDAAHEAVAAAAATATIPARRRPFLSCFFCLTLVTLRRRDPRADVARLRNISEGDRYSYTNHISFIERWNGITWQQLPSSNR
jgi:hypothetical protein